MMRTRRAARLRLLLVSSSFALIGCAGFASVGPGGVPVPATTSSEPATEAVPEPTSTTTVSPPPVTPPSEEIEAAKREPPPPAPVPETGKIRIQLSAKRSRAQALVVWEALGAKHKDLFAGLEPAIERADLGERGIFYRLRTGSFADRDEAQAMCRKLADRKIDCLVVSP